MPRIYEFERPDGRHITQIFMHEESSDEVSTISTNATADDLPGPGRIIDTYFYQAYGKKLERLLGVIGHRLGFGPVAAYEEILKIVQTNSRPKRREKKEKKVSEKCKTLLKYTHSDIPLNQKNALDSITQLALEHPETQETFRQRNAAIILDSLPRLIISRRHATSECDLLLSASRKALFSVDSPLSGPYKDFCYFLDQDSRPRSPRMRILPIVYFYVTSEGMNKAFKYYMETVELHVSTVRGRNTVYSEIACAQLEYICNKYRERLCGNGSRRLKILLMLDKLRSGTELDSIFIIRVAHRRM